MSRLKTCWNWALLGLGIGYITVLGGCVSAPSVDPVPELVSGADEGKYQGARKHEGAAWWKDLGSEELDALITAGIHGSPSTQIAIARLNQAEADLNVARSFRLPTLSVAANHTKRDFFGGEADTRTESANLGLTWDLGLWGKRRLQIEEAGQLREQRWFEQQAVELALSATIAETYFGIVEQQMQTTLLGAQVGVSESLEHLIEARFRLGQARANELYQQREATSALRTLLLSSQTELETLEMNLDVLVGALPDAQFRVTGEVLPAPPVSVELGAPTDLIRHRADVRAAYARLRQAATQAGISFADRLPALQVTADLSSLAQKAASSDWLGYGLDLTAPVFSAGRLRSLEIRALEALEEERQRYLQSWLNALEEVTVSQARFEQQGRIIESLNERRSHAQAALTAARNRYTLGDQNYLEVLTALRGLQETDRILVAEQRQHVTLWIRFVEAIGQPMCRGDVDCQLHWQLEVDKDGA